MTGGDGDVPMDGAVDASAFEAGSGDATSGSDGAGDATGDDASDAAGGGDAADARSDVIDAGGDAARDADAGRDASADANDASSTTADGGFYSCDGGGMSDCTGCAVKQPCVYCAPDGGLYGRCIATGVHCNTAIPTGYAMCTCNFPDASACVGDFQVCHDGTDGKTCRTCGEPNTATDSCKSGGTCQGNGTCN